MNFNQILVTNGKQAIALKILLKIIVNCVLIKIMPLNEQLRIILKFHKRQPYFPLSLFIKIKKIKPDRIAEAAIHTAIYNGDNHFAGGTDYCLI